MLCVFPIGLWIFAFVPAASSYPMLGPSLLLLLVATLIAAPAGALTTSSERYAVHEINFDHTNATDWGGTNAGPYQEA